jgi:ketosteroid isomerase-like protein
MKSQAEVRAWTLQFLAPWNDHDKAGVLATLPEDFEWQFTVGTDPNGTVHRGKKEIGEALDKLFAAIPNLRYDIVSLHAGENHIVMELLVTGNNRETGMALNYQACDIVLFDRGALREKRSYRKVVSPK